MPLPQSYQTAAGAQSCCGRILADFLNLARLRRRLNLGYREHGSQLPSRPTGRLAITADFSTRRTLASFVESTKALSKTDQTDRKDAASQHRNIDDRIPDHGQVGSLDQNAKGGVQVMVQR